MKVLLGQAALVHRKRRTWRRRTLRRPWQGRSATVRRWRPWIRSEGLPQPGQTAIDAMGSARTATRSGVINDPAGLEAGAGQEGLAEVHDGNPNRPGDGRGDPRHPTGRPSRTLRENHYPAAVHTAPYLAARESAVVK